MRQLLQCFALLFFTGIQAQTYNYVSQFGNNGNSNGQFSNPVGITMDSAGDLYVVDQGNNRIQKFDSNGNYIMQFGSGLDTPVGVIVDGFGNIYVASYNNDQVHKYGPAGNLIFLFGISGSGDGEFSGPTHLALDNAGNVYVLDKFNNRVQKFDPSGNYISQFGSAGSGNGQLNWPSGISIDASGNIYIGDSGNNRVQKFMANGNYLLQFGSLGGAMDHINGLKTDASGNVFVVDDYNSRVQKFTSTGVFLNSFGTYGSTNGQFFLPYDVVLNNLQEVFVADAGNHRIQKFAFITGVEEINAKPGISVFPNPSQNIINIYFSGSTDVSYTLINGNGKSVLNGDIFPGNNQILINDLDCGVYLLRTNDPFERVHRIIKN